MNKRQTKKNGRIKGLYQIVIEIKENLFLFFSFFKKKGKRKELNLNRQNKMEVKHRKNEKNIVHKEENNEIEENEE